MINKIEATISRITKEDLIHLVEFISGKSTLYMLSLELPHIDIGSKVLLSVKPTHLFLSKNPIEDISILNVLAVCIDDIKEGKVVSAVSLRGENYMLESVITKEALCKMDLKKGDDIFALIDPSELFVSEVL